MYVSLIQLQKVVTDCRDFCSLLRKCGQSAEERKAGERNIATLHTHKQQKESKARLAEFLSKSKDKDEMNTSR